MSRPKRVVVIVVPVVLAVAATWFVLTRQSDAVPAGVLVERGDNALKSPSVVATSSTVAMAAAATPPVEGFLDTDGLRVAAFIDKLAPQARKGDVEAAMRLYRVERFCYFIDLEAKSPPEDDEDRAQFARSQALCEGVTPAQFRERIVFLDQGLRAGLEEALLAFCQEGPDGLAIDELDPQDPRLVAWKQQANDTLHALAAKGNHMSWIMLAQSYETGVVAPVDLHASVMYWSAWQAARFPGKDPLTVNFIAELVKQLPPDDAQLALRLGLELGQRFPVVRNKT